MRRFAVGDKVKIIAEFVPLGARAPHREFSNLPVHHPYGIITDVCPIDDLRKYDYRVEYLAGGGHWHWFNDDHLEPTEPRPVMFSDFDLEDIELAEMIIDEINNA